MSDQVGNLAVVVSADVGPAERKIAGFTKTVDKLDNKINSIGKSPPKMKGFDKRPDRGFASNVEERRSGDFSRRGRIGDPDRWIGSPPGRGGRVGRGGQSGKSADMIAGKLADVAGLGEVVSAGMAGGPAVAAVTAGLLGLATAGILVKKSLDLAGGAEKNRLAFEAMTGSAEAAGRVLGKLRKYAQESPFSTSQVLDIGKRLLAFGIDAEQVTPTVRALGDITAATGGDFGRLALAFGQVRTTGRLMGDELNQFAEQGVPLIDALADVMKKPKDEIKKLVSEGEVGFDKVVEAINRMTSAGGRFAGLQEKYAKSFEGLKERLGDTAEGLGRDLGTALIEDLNLKPILADITRHMESFRPLLRDARPGLKEIGYWLGKAVKYSVDLGITATKTGRLLAAMGKAFFSPELKQASERIESLKKLLGDIDGMDFQEVFHQGIRVLLTELRPAALGVADTIDGIGDGLKKFEEIWKGVGEVAGKAFDAISAGAKAMLAPLDAGIATLKAFQEVLKDPSKLKDLKLDVVIADAIKEIGQARPVERKNLKGDADIEGWRRERERELRGANETARSRLEKAFDAADKLNDAMEEAHRAEKYRLSNIDKNLGAAFGTGYQKAKDFVAGVVDANSGLKSLAGLVEKGRSFLGFSTDALKASQAISQAMKDDARKLNEEYGDPFAKLSKRAKELDAMMAAGLIDNNIRGLAFDADVNKLLKDRGERNRMAPAAEYGSQQFAQLVQQAVGSAPKDQLSLLREQLQTQKQIAQNGNDLLLQLQKLTPPKLQKLPGE